MAVNNTGATAKKFIKPSYIVATLFTGTEEDDVPKGDSYILEDVVEDTTSIAQDDNDVNDIECETSDSPILSIVKLGKYQFAAEVADTQKRSANRSHGIYGWNYCFYQILCSCSIQEIVCKD